MATLALAGGAAALGGSLAGPAGAQAGLLLGQVASNFLSRPKPEQRFGPRLGDDQITDSTEGIDIPIVWGRDRLAGQLIWQGPRQEIENEEDVGGKGGPTATVTTYTYRRSFAVDFGAFESDAILRIWLNKELAYDVRPTAVAMQKKGLSITIYLGTETQEPDPVIEAVVGSGNVSAHRGHTYIVFDSYDVTNTGGRPPSVEAEVITSGSQGAQSVTIDCNTEAQTLDVMHWDRFNGLLYACFPGGTTGSGIDAICAVIDPFARALVKLIDHGPGNRSTCIPFTTLDAIEYNAGFNNRVAVYARNTFAVYDTNSFKRLSNFDAGTDPIAWMMETRTGIAIQQNSVFKFWPKTGSTFTAQTIPTGYTNELAQWGDINNTWLIKVLKKTATGEYAAVRYNASTLGGSWEDIKDWGENEADWDIEGIVYDSINAHLWCLVNEVVGSGSSLFKLDTEGSLIGQVALGNLGTPATSNGFWPLYFDASTKSLYLHESTNVYIFNVITEELTTKTIVHTSSWSVYIPELGEVWCGNPDNANRCEVYGDAINRVTANAVNDADIIADICALAGIPSASLNVSQVTTTRVGFKHSRRVQARADLEPILIAAQLDVVQSDYKLKFVPRGGAIAATIDPELLGAHVKGTSPPPALQHTFAQGVDYPVSVDLHYKSVEADLQPGLARADWYTNDDSEHQETLTLPIVMADADASELADSYLQSLAEKDRFEWFTPRYYANLEPTDCVNHTVNGETVRVRIIDVQRGADGVHQWSGELDDPADLASYAVAGGGGVQSATVELFSVPQLIVIDSSLLRDIDNDHPGPYLAGYTRSTGFPGAVIHVSADGTNYVQTNSMSEEPTLGKVATVPDRVILDAWDETNTLSAALINGSLSSKTDAEVLAGANAMLWGLPGRWEVIQPATCAFVSGTTYNLSRILRGRRGTDWAMELHEIDDWLIVADTQTLRRLVLANQDIAANRWLKLPAVGTAPADAPPTLITVGQAPLMPYSAIEFEGTFSGSGCTLDWVRRTRKGGSYGGTNSLVDGVGGSISEDSEGWEIDIFKVGDYETPVRTLTATTNSKLYAAADMSIDGIPADGPFLARLYQISAVVGRGYVNEAFFADTLADAMGTGYTAFYKLDETTGTTAADEGANYNAAINGSVTLNKTGLAGTGTCFGFGAVGQEVYKTGETGFVLGDEWTIVLWLAPTTSATTRQVLKFRDISDKVLLRLNSSDELEALVRDESNTQRGPLTSAALTSGTAYSVILTADGTHVRLYIDGVLAEKLAVTGTTWGNNPNFTIGDSNCGDVDEVAFYKRTFSQAEIDTILALA